MNNKNIIQTSVRVNADLMSLPPFDRNLQEMLTAQLSMKRNNVFIEGLQD